MIEKIISGGQTGADRGGLNAAIHCKVPHGGWCPRERRAEDGVIPDRYRLTEHPSREYILRTEANIVDSDVTLVFTFGQPTGGSRSTVELAEKHGRPCLHIDFAALQELAAIGVINTWLERVCPGNVIVNVAGSRASKSPGLAMKVMRVMTNVLNHFNHCGGILYPLHQEGVETQAIRS